MKLLLLGYMGCGKSFYAKKLAEKKDVNFVDLDNYIEEKENASIATLFEKKGEVYFRKVEAKYLDEVLQLEQNAVVALGGGTPCYGNNLEKIKSQKDCVSVYLQKNILDISKDLYAEKSTRPLIAHFSNQEDLVEYISKHLFERQVFYFQADHKINLSQVASNDEVLEELSSIFEANHS